MKNKNFAKAVIPYGMTRDKARVGSSASNF